MHVCMSQILVVCAIVQLLACLVIAGSENDLRTEVVGAVSSDPSKWKGHLQPLGAAAEKKPVESMNGFPSPEDFFDDYLGTHTPLLMRGAAKTSPAFNLWSDDYFLSFKEAEELEVSAEQRKKENRTKSPESMTFKTFVRTYREKDIYLVNSVPKFLQ